MRRDAGKRLLDLVLVLATAPLWLPVMALTAALVRVALGPPVLFVQCRSGRDGHPFNIVKFRTMTGARDASGQLLPDHERLTKFGRFLRSTSLDEVPELVNVLRGDMSLVGPRPLLPQYLSRYSTYHQRRHEVRPGITGLAQVFGRNELSWPQKLDLDVSYVDTRSVGMDLMILARTIGAVLTRRGVSAEGDATMPEFTGYSPPPLRNTNETPR